MVRWSTQTVSLGTQSGHDGFEMPSSQGQVDPCGLDGSPTEDPAW